MKWTDFQKAVAENKKKTSVIDEQYRPIQSESYKLENDHCREWKLDERFYARFNARFVNEDWSPLGLSFCDPQGASPRYSKAGLRRAMAVVDHIESWRAGRIDELKPSGPWDKDVPT